MRQSLPLPPGVTVFERGWLSSNNILFAGRSADALVDSGYCTHAGQTVALVERALAGRPLDLLLNTHLHSDHCGGNAALRSRFAAMRTLIPPGQAQAVRDWDTVALTYAPTGQDCPRFRFEGLLLAGEEIELADRPWQIHSAPGHDPHSVVLFEPQSRTLVSADALWQAGFGIVFPELEGEEGFADVAATLDRIEALQPAIIIPGHGPVFSDIAAALAIARSRLAAYRSDPRRHAAHAGKVLLKFKLLELQEVPLAELMRWAEGAPYISMVHARYFAQIAMQDWLCSLADSLVHSGAAVVAGDRIVNS